MTFSPTITLRNEVTYYYVFVVTHYLAEVKRRSHMCDANANQASFISLPALSAIAQTWLDNNANGNRKTDETTDKAETDRLERELQSK